MLNIVDVTFDFEFGDLDGRFMNVAVTSGDQTVNVTPDNPSVKLEKIKMPTQIKMDFTGKRQGKDTKVDSNGIIVQDMHVKLKGMRLDHMKVPEWVLQKKLAYTTASGETLKTAYIGFNGTMVIDIPETNVFSLFRRLNKDE